MRRSLVLTSVLGACSSVVPQVVGLLMLDSEAFGAFSAVYLIFALGTSLTLSVVCDTWVLCEGESSDEGWDSYSSILLVCSLIGALGAAVVGLATLRSVSGGLAVFFGVGASLYRLGSRYYLMHRHSWSLAATSDLTVVLGTVLTVWLCAGSLAPVTALLVGWGTGSLGGAIFSGTPSIRIGKGIGWARRNRRTIGPLVVDSLVMDLSSVGAPYVLLPVLGLGGFGIYRGVSNLSAPLRLLITPIRPVIVRRPDKVVNLRGAVGVGLIAVLSALAAGIALQLVRHLPLKLGVLSELVIFALPVGVYLGGATLVTVYALVCRSRRTSGRLLAGRTINTICGLVGPLGGYLVAGLPGAVWGYAIGTLVSGVAWFGLSVGGRRTTEEVS